VLESVFGKFPDLKVVVAETFPVTIRSSNVIVEA
jgi:hypothetical protein